MRLQCGGLNSARILLHSVEFHDIEQRQHMGDWDGTAQILGEAAKGLKAAGADFLVIATNTQHKVVRQIETTSGLEILHITDPTGETLVRDAAKRVALRGTHFTMEQDVYRDRLEKKFGLEVMVPQSADCDTIHRVIYDELCLGVTKPASMLAYINIISRLKVAGAEAVILGCTEITMIVNAANSPLPVYDTTRLRALAAVEKAPS